MYLEALITNNKEKKKRHSPSNTTCLPLTFICWELLVSMTKVKQAWRCAKLLKRKQKICCFPSVWGLCTYGKGNWAMLWNKIVRHIFWVAQRMTDVLKCSEELWEVDKEASVW